MKRKRIRKYVKGKRIRNVATLVGLIQSHQYIIWNGRPLHWAMTQNMSLSTLMSGVLRGIVFEAKLTK